MNLAYRIVGIAILLVVVAGSVRAEEDKGEKWGKVTDEQWNLAAPDSFPEAAAVVIFDNGSLEVPPPYVGNYVEFKRHIRIKIFRKAGAEEVVKAEVPGSNPRGFGAQTILRNGKKIEVSGKDRFVKKIGSDEEVTTFTFPALEDGCIIEYKYSYLQNNYSILRSWNFQSDLYTIKSKFTLTLWGGFDYSARLTNVPESLRTPTRKELTLERMGPVEFVWVLRDQIPIESEPYMAAASNYRAKLTCQLNSYKDLDNTLYFAKDWKTLGDKMLEYYDLFVGSKGDLVKTAKSLVEGMSTPIDKIRRIYQYARDEILTQGEEATNWFDKDNLGKVLKERGGNGGEKNALLTEMLRAVDIEASPLLIGTRDHAAFDPRVYMIQQFNHLICHVASEGQVYLLDASNRGVPFPYLPPDDLTSGGLLLKKKASEPIQIGNVNRRSAFETFSKLRVHADGSATCTTHVSMRGYQIHAKRDLLQDNPSKELLGSILLNDANVQFEVSSYYYSREIDNDSASVDVVLTFPSLCLVTGNQLVCTPPVALWTASPFSKPKRHFPIDFAYPREYLHVIDLDCDEGLALAALPENASESMDGIGFTRSILATDRSARLMMQFIISKPVFPPALYVKLRGLFAKVCDSAAEPVTITF
jgi:hypothetical protein